MSTTTQSLVQRTTDDAFAVLTINHPPVNALTPELLAELEAAFESLGREDAVHVVVLTGTGRVFMAGADVRVLAAIPSASAGEEEALRGQAVLNRIEAFEKPVIAAINGACLGAGLELAMCCHLRLAADGARLGQPEINLGIMPGFGGTQRLPRLIGLAKAAEMVLSGEALSAQEARDLGLVTQVVPADDLLRQAKALARRIAAKGQVAVRHALRSLRESQTLSLREGLSLEARLFGELCGTEDRKEGLAAFLEKRQPRFKDK